MNYEQKIKLASFKSRLINHADDAAEIASIKEEISTEITTSEEEMNNIEDRINNCRNFYEKIDLQENYDILEIFVNRLYELIE